MNNVHLYPKNHLYVLPVKYFPQVFEFFYITEFIFEISILVVQSKIDILCYHYVGCKDIYVNKY